MATRRYYSQSPLIEALCQFKFEPGMEWDMAIPGLLYQQFKAEFPERRQQKAFEFTVGPDIDDLKTQATPNRMQFRKADGSALIQVGPDLLIVNALRPYPGWERFRAMILSALETYCREASPRGIKSLALRYINRLTFPFDSVDISDYLLFSPGVPDSLPQTFVEWAQSVAMPAGRDDILRLTGGSREENPEEIVFVLDIEFVAIRGCDLADVGPRIDKAHDQIESAFEACITEKSRLMFREESHEHAQSF